ncbi:MAG TPA: hypothetical protein VGV37_11080 [Aliidongia sp.]|uniref:hypothetical protein n=1 Tax=Aliidongia sp. TaxID=1914230 RepID=UPI002DDDA9FD|nr:hypothetical protein [Aliidongia sp.]HEV2675074.1 hypothetical protein [Aliidongia sp.]
MPSTETAQSVVNVSILTPKPDRFEECVALQMDQYLRLRGQVEGLKGSRFYRSTDGRQLVLLAVFETAGDAGRFAQDPRFTEHLARMRPLIETAVPGTYEMLYGFGEI